MTSNKFTDPDDLITNREYQSTIFTTYFGEPVRAAQLYEGIAWLESRENESPMCHDGQLAGAPQNSQTESVGPEDIVFETLEGVLYLARKNDLAFTVRKKVLVIGEHQSTVNQNMPLRSAIYYGRTMEKLIDPRAIYKSKRIPIPTPEFYLFYNGKSPQPLERTLYLSDSYLEKTSHPMLELKVKMININLPEGHPLLERCRPLYEYSWFTWKVREYLERGKDRDEAIARAMEASVRQGILTEFIQRHGSEVRNMLYTEFNLEDAREVWEEEAREDGLRQGLEQGLEQGRAEGADRILIELVIKKLRKGKSPEVIANELETPAEKIRDIRGFVAPFAPDYDLEAIFASMGDQIKRKTT